MHLHLHKYLSHPRKGTITLDLPTTIELDILHPRPKTTANNNDTFPVIFALQSASAAQYFHFTVLWRIHNEDDILRDSGSIDNYAIQYKFRYVTKSTDTIYLVDSVSENRLLKPGEHTLTWEYVMSPCTQSANTITRHIATIVMSGNYPFTIVDDGSGVDLELPVGSGSGGDGDDGEDCPVYGNRTTARSVAFTGYPFLERSDGDEQPCKARSEDESQDRCIRNYLSGRNYTEACTEGLKMVEWDWPGDLAGATVGVRRLGAQSLELGL